MKFASQKQNLAIQAGQIEDDKARSFSRNGIGAVAKKVEATRNSILSGPPGVGKTFGTMEECNKHNIDYLTITPGMSDIQLACKLALGVYETVVLSGKELCVILDDADDVVFGDYQTLNKWKIAMGDIDYSSGIVPTYNHPVSMFNTLTALEKAGKNKMVEAIKYFQGEDDFGLSIPTDKVRFIVLCNRDLEDPKAFTSKKIYSAVEAVMDRFNYKRMNLDWEKQWGWLAYTLSNSQPFPEYPITDDQKKDLLMYMWANWNNLRSTSYRTVRKLVEAMINDPENYIDLWDDQLKGH